MNGSSSHSQQMSSFREDKENIPHEDDDEDGPILYRDDDSMEDEGECLHRELDGGRNRLWHFYVCIDIEPVFSNMPN